MNELIDLVGDIAPVFLVVFFIPIILYILIRGVSKKYRKSDTNNASNQNPNSYRPSKTFVVIVWFIFAAIISVVLFFLYFGWVMNNLFF